MLDLALPEVKEMLWLFWVTMSFMIQSIHWVSSPMSIPAPPNLPVLRALYSEALRTWSFL